MALSDAQRDQVYEFLGYPLTTIFGTRSQTLVTIMDNLTSNGEARVVDLVTKIATSRSDIGDAQGRLKASKVGDLDLNKDELKQRWKEDYRLCRQLSILLGAPIVSHPSQEGIGCPEIC